MRTEQSAEDYLEAIHVLRLAGGQVHQVDVSRRLGVSQPAVNKALRKLIDAGYVRTEGLHIFLTERGEARATEIYGKHVNLRNFLMLLGVTAETAEEDACALEHIVSEETYAAVKQFIAERTAQSSEK